VYGQFRCGQCADCDGSCPPSPDRQNKTPSVQKPFFTVPGMSTDATARLDNNARGSIWTLIRSPVLPLPDWPDLRQPHVLCRGERITQLRHGSSGRPWACWQTVAWGRSATRNLKKAASAKSTTPKATLSLSAAITPRIDGRQLVLEKAFDGACADL